MRKVPPSWRWLAVMSVSALLAACGGDDEDDRPQQPVEGTFVGKVAGTDALVAVVAAPPQRGRDRREVTLYVSDGQRVSESLTGSVQSNGFSATSQDRDVEATGRLSRGGVTGTVELPGGESAKFQATRATAAAGLYDLTVSSNGRLSGASATGVGLESSSTVRAPGTGRLRFADGERRKFALTSGSSGDPTRLRDGQLRLIVLPSGELSGAGEAQASNGGDELELFIRSSDE